MRSDDAPQDQDEEDAGGEQQGCKGGDADAGAALGGGGGEQTGPAQTVDHGLIQQQDAGTVEAGFQQIEGQEHGHEHPGDVRAGGAGHVQRRDEVIPQQHGGDHHHGARDEARDGTGHGVPPLVDVGGGEGEGAGGQRIRLRTEDI